MSEPERFKKSNYFEERPKISADKFGHESFVSEDTISTKNSERKKYLKLKVKPHKTGAIKLSAVEEEYLYKHPQEETMDWWKRKELPEAIEMEKHTDT